MWPDLRNFVPLPYRNVSLQKIEGPLDEISIRKFMNDKKVFEATEFIVFESSGQFSILRVRVKGSGVFREVTDIQFLTSPSQCHFVARPDIDVGNPSELARVAHELQVSPLDALIIEGRFGHLNFILRPDPIVITVVDLIPPESRLVDLVMKALEFGQFQACRVKPDPIQLQDRAAHSSKTDILVPCRVSGFSLTQKRVHFLDEHPPLSDWTLTGCPRSEEIYVHFYGEAPTDRIETCPRRIRGPFENPTILRCCWQKPGTFDHGPHFVVIPWGADVHLTIEALRHLINNAEANYRQPSEPGKLN